ncbi:MAG: alkaline phosphatase D family protein [Acidobacteriota bacterium]
MGMVVGPVLGFQGQTINAKKRSEWCVCALIVAEGSDVEEKLSWSSNGNKGKTVNPIVLKEYQQFKLLRFDWAIEQTEKDQIIEYQIANGTMYSFTVPAQGVLLRLAYNSCSGFSTLQAMKRVADKNAMWNVLATQHALKPFHLLLMGGDQIYADLIWEVVPTIKKWAELPAQERFSAPFTAEMQAQVEEFYFLTYYQRWSQPEIAKVIAQIPTLMMWDDHDIFDGWGSYPPEQQASQVFQGIYTQAREYFSLFQLQTNADAAFTGRLPEQEGFNYAYRIGDIAILVLDMRSERSQHQVIGEKAWKACLRWLDSLQDCKHLLVMTSIPVVFVNFNLVESLLGWLPGQQELEDDLKDHWMSRTHQGERMRLIHRLLKYSQKTHCRVTILSGDVHVGALGIIQSERNGSPNENINVINQLISSGIVHPPPPSMLLYFMEKVIGGGVEEIDRGITAQMIKFPCSSQRFIGARNWLSLAIDHQHCIWAEWYVEGSKDPYTKVIHPID